MENLDEINWELVTKKIEERYPFVKMMLMGEIKYMDVDGFLIQVNAKLHDEKISVHVGKKHLSYSIGGETINEDLCARLISQTLFLEGVFNSYFTAYQNKEGLRNLETKLNQLYEMISCAPGGPAYEAAKLHFKKLI